MTTPRRYIDLDDALRVVYGRDDPEDALRSLAVRGVILDPDDVRTAILPGPLAESQAAAARVLAAITPPTRSTPPPPDAVRWLQTFRLWGNGRSVVPGVAHAFRGSGVALCGYVPHLRTSLRPPLSYARRCERCGARSDA